MANKKPCTADPYHQRQKCNPGTPVFNNMKSICRYSLVFAV